MSTSVPSVLRVYLGSKASKEGRLPLFHPTSLIVLHFSRAAAQCSQRLRIIG